MLKNKERKKQVKEKKEGKKERKEERKGRKEKNSPNFPFGEGEFELICVQHCECNKLLQ